MSNPIVDVQEAQGIDRAIDGRAEVWQSVNPRFGSAIRMGMRRRFPSDYRRVFLVDSTDPEEVFALTNCFDDDSRVEAVHQENRSTSIDDVVVLPSGKHYWLGLDGWEAFFESAY